MDNTNIKEELFGDIDFTTIANDDNFKEDSVRERIIMPIIKKLGFTEDNIERSKSLKHPFLKVGSNKKMAITLIPDYAIKIGEFYAWVLDAKSPKKNVSDEGNVEQVYSYASHPEIRCKYFAICNGIEIVVYRTNDTNSPLLRFKLEDINSNWKILERYLSVNSFQTDENILYEKVFLKQDKNFDYKNRSLPKEIIPRKQAAKRHFGCTAYFTRQVWNVVQEYIKHYTQEGDLVLDPFGGSGMTAIEAMMTERKAIHLDLNPLSTFIIESLVAPVNRNELSEAFENIKKEFLKDVPNTNNKIKEYLKKHKLSKKLDWKLPKKSDVKKVKELFSDKQLAHLSLLKRLIGKEKNENIKKSLFLAFYNTLTKCNLTFHKNPKGGGNYFGYYNNYRMAPHPTELSVIEVFEKKFKRILDGKADVEYYINENTIDNIDVRKGTATDLSFIENESVDYIYTDPPYGKNIAYLDLSTMWNAWLDLDVTEDDYKLEAIEGGDLDKTKEEYKDLIAKSIQEMYRVLKFDRWMSFVFAHKDPEFWHLIINTAENCGFEYIGSVVQKNGQTSYRKRKHPRSTLSGQLIMNFRKSRTPRAIMQANLGMSISDKIMFTIEETIIKNYGASIEQINEAIVIKGLELGFLHELKKEYSDLTPLLNNYKYDSEAQKYFIRKSFIEHIPLEKRIGYWITSYMRGKERIGEIPTTDEIILNTMQSLTNGKPFADDQTILKVLKDIATPIGDEGWKLSNGELF